MVDIALHVRIFEVDPTDDIVDKRKKAVDELTKKFASRKQVAKVLQLASNLSGWVQDSTSMPEPLAAEVEECLKGASSSFVREGKGVEMVTCALLAAAQLIEKSRPEGAGASKSACFAAALWSALSFQPPKSELKFEKLRQEIIGLARGFAIEFGRVSRLRADVGDLDIDVPEGEGANYGALVENIEEGVSGIIGALVENAELDREEIDVLWWALGGWSEAINCRFSSLSSDVAAVVGGIELADKLNGLPCDAHKHLVLRNVNSAEEMLTLAEVVGRVREYTDELSPTLANLSIPAGNERLFPLLAAISSGAIQLPGGELKRKIDEWGGRALFEAAALRHIAESSGE